MAQQAAAQQMDTLRASVARSLRLMSDLNRNLLLLNQLYWQAGRKNDAQRVLLEALQSLLAMEPLAALYRLLRVVAHRLPRGRCKCAQVLPTRHSMPDGCASG